MKYQFRCTLGFCISENNSIYIGLTSTTLSKRLTLHLSDFIAQHLKNIAAQKLSFGKFSPKTQQYKNNKITNKNY